MIQTKFKGLKIVQNKNNFDLRGNLVEIYKKIINKNYIFDYYSKSKKNVLEDYIFKLQINKKNTSRFYTEVY